MPEMLKAVQSVVTTPMILAMRRMVLVCLGVRSVLALPEFWMKKSRVAMIKQTAMIHALSRNMLAACCRMLAVVALVFAGRFEDEPVIKLSMLACSVMGAGQEESVQGEMNV